MVRDPILAALSRIESKQDDLLANQERMDAEIKQIHKDTKRISAITGAAAGAASGGLVAAGIMAIKAKLGFF